jgi:hypothetical protein
MRDRELKIERIREMPELKKEIIKHLWDYLKNKRDSDRWWKFNGKFIFEGKPYVLEAEVRLDNKFLQYRGMLIEHEQQVIEIDDLVAKGFLN